MMNVEQGERELKQIYAPDGAFSKNKRIEEKLLQYRENQHTFHIRTTTNGPKTYRNRIETEPSARIETHTEAGEEHNS